MSSLIPLCLRAGRACGKAVPVADPSAFGMDCLRLDHLKLLGPLGFAVMACLFPLDLVAEACIGGFVLCFLMLCPSLRECLGPQKLRSFGETLVQQTSQRRGRRNDTFTAFKRADMQLANTTMDGQVVELLNHMDIDVVMSEKLRVLKTSLTGILQMSFPSVDVQVIAASNPDFVRAFGTAIPEVVVLLTIPPDEMCKMPVSLGKDRQRLSACLRACIATLVKNGFRFRRSDFTADNPKVIFLADAYEFAMDVYINSVVPLKFQSLLDYVGKQDPLAKDLVLLVRHWARERGLALVAAGYVSLYAWTVLALFYVQIVYKSKKLGSGLTSLAHYLQDSSGPHNTAMIPSGGDANRDGSCTGLFRGFMSFYAKDFDWCNEIVSLRLGLRQTRTFSIGQLTRIEDPFDASKDLTVSFNLDNLERLREELLRAHRLLEQEGSMGVLMEAWRKPGAS